MVRFSNVLGTLDSIVPVFTKQIIENVKETDHPLIMQAMESSFPLADIEKTLNELAQRAQHYDVDWLKQEFRYFVAGYQDGTSTEELIISNIHQITETTQ